MSIQKNTVGDKHETEKLSNMLEKVILYWHMTNPDYLCPWSFTFPSDFKGIDKMIQEGDELQELTDGQ